MANDYAPIIDDEEDEEKKKPGSLPDPVTSENADFYGGSAAAPKSGVAPMIAPPAAPDIHGIPPVGDPGDGQIGPAPVQGRPLPPPRPTPGQFAPKPQTRMGRLFNGLAVGAAAMNPKNPGAGMEVNHELNVAPQERAQQAYEAAAGAYDTEKAQGLAERKQITDEDKEKNAKDLAERVPVRLADGRTAYIPQKDLARFLGTQETNTTKEKTNEATNTSKENISSDTNRTKQDISDNANENKQDIAAQNIESRDSIARQADRTKRELGFAKVALAKNKVEKAPPEVAKAHRDLEMSVGRMNLMQTNAEEAKGGNQQAMLALVNNHIGMTAGLVPNQRINKHQYEEAEQSAPWLQRVKARFDSDGYLSGVVLTPKQIDQMVGLAVDRLAEDRRIFKDTQDYYGYEGHGGTAQNPGGGATHPVAKHDTAAGTINAPKTAEDYMKKLQTKKKE